LYSKIRIVCALAVIMEGPTSEFVVPGIGVVRVFHEKLG
jgi:hypothetical protein